MLMCRDETEQRYSPWSSLFRFDICRDRFPGEVLFNSLTRPVCLSLCSWGYISSELVLCSGVNVHVNCFGLACSSVHEQGRMTHSPERSVTLIILFILIQITHWQHIYNCYLQNALFMKNKYLLNFERYIFQAKCFHLPLFLSECL